MWSSVDFSMIVQGRLSPDSQGGGCKRRFIQRGNLFLSRQPNSEADVAAK